jgi:hypothetical protein
VISQDYLQYQVNDSVISSQVYPNLTSQFAAFLDSFGNYITHGDIICELDGIICSRNSNKFSLRRFYYYSGWKYSCPSISIPNLFSTAVSFTLHGLGCTNRFVFNSTTFNLTLLDLSNDGLNSSFLETNFGSQFPNLTTLILDSNDFSAQSTPILNIPSSLKILSLDDTEIPKVSFPVGKVLGLENLSVCNYASSSAVHVAVTNLPSGLVSLNLSSLAGIVLNENSNSLNFSNFSSLVALDLWGVSFNETAKLSFPYSLQILKFQFCHGSNSFFPNPLSQLTNLRVLYVQLAGDDCSAYRWTTMFSTTTQNLASLSNLQDLYVYSSQVDFSLSWIPNMNLQKLTFDSVMASSSNLFSLDLQRFSSLRYLTFQSTEFPVDNIQFTFPSALQVLEISDGNLLQRVIKRIFKP